MKLRLSKYPNLSRYLLAILLFGIALFITGLLNKGAIKAYFPYVSVILLFIATWWLYKTENKSLSAIGLNFSLKNISFLPLGIAIGALAFLGSICIKAIYLGETIEIAETINFSTILLSFYFILPQVATEEFLFRGYLFKKTTEVANVIIANVIFSILFMLIHVLDENILSNKGMILLLAITIPVGHLLFATALLKSKTLFFPIGIHLGNNWATRHLISSSTTGDSILYVSETSTFDTWLPFITMLALTNGFFLFVTFIIWKWDKITLYFKKNRS